MVNMYTENRKSINAFVGCDFGCVYCVPSFQRQMKRQKNRCKLCYAYMPHFHPKRLLKSPPKTRDDEFIFFPSSGDLSWASNFVIEKHISYARKYPDRDFLIQSKNPSFFSKHKWSNNVILGTTLETNSIIFPDTPSIYHWYASISKAPNPSNRVKWLSGVNHKRKAVTVEPILSFVHNIMIDDIVFLNPEFIYVGYDNHNCKLPEPSLADTKKLVRELEERGFDVRIKSLRKAWWE